jgi:hypothetical protein
MEKGTKDITYITLNRFIAKSTNRNKQSLIIGLAIRLSILFHKSIHSYCIAALGAFEMVGMPEFAHRIHVLALDLLIATVTHFRFDWNNCR